MVGIISIIAGIVLNGIGLVHLNKIKKHKKYLKEKGVDLDANYKKDAYKLIIASMFLGIYLLISGYFLQPYF